MLAAVPGPRQGAGRTLVVGARELDGERFGADRARDEAGACSTRFISAMPSTVASGRSRTTTAAPSLPYASTPCVFANAYGIRAASAGSGTVAADCVAAVIADSTTMAATWPAAPEWSTAVSARPAGAAAPRRPASRAFREARGTSGRARTSAAAVACRPARPAGSRSART